MTLRALAFLLLGAQFAAASPSNPAGLLFRSGFEGATALGTPTDCYRGGCWQDILGRDSTTGFAWPPSVSGSRGRFQLLVDGPQPTPATVGDYMLNQIQAGAGRNGSRALYGEIRQSGCCGTDPQKSGATQNPYLLLPASEVRDLYISYWVKLQPDLVQKLHLGRAWRVLFQWKSAGDFRVILSMVAHARGEAPFWQIGADNVANGGLPHEQYWRVYNRSVPVPVGRWFKLEVFWHRSSGSDGRVWMAIDGQVIVDRFGPLMGVNNARIDRIMVTQIYSGGAYPIYQWVDDLQIWSRFPTAAPGDPWYDPPYAPH